MHNEPKKLSSVVLHWLPLASVIVMLGFVGYGLSQFVVRSSVDETPAQIAVNISDAIKAGTPVAELIPANAQSDLATEFAPFVILYDGTGTPISSTAILEKSIPIISKNTLEKSKKTGESRITWEPKKDVRLAIVIKPFPGEESGYILSGKSLHEADIRIKSLCNIATTGTIATLILSLFFAFAIFMIEKKKHAHGDTVTADEAPQV